MRFLYTLVLRAAVPLILLRLWWRGRRERDYRDAVGERFGLYGDGAPDGSCIWFHAVSVGEARAAAPLVRAIAAEYPDHRVVMTCMTAAGRQTVRQVYGESVEVAWLPYDLPGGVQRFLEHFRPALGIIMETELWPNLLAACADNGVPVILANARMSERSARGYARWEGVTGAALRSFAAVLAQSGADAARLRSLGAPRVEVSGNLKFDVPPDLALVQAGRAWRERLGRPVLLLASTREGEEKMLLDALPGQDASRLVVVVPRHPQRFDEVARLAGERRTRSEVPQPSTAVYLGDTMGEMPFYYAACDVAVIGGSFLPLGGQNLIEALSAGAPVIVGPHMFNFAEATRLATAAGAAIQASDAAAALRSASQLLSDAERRGRMTAAGRKLVEEHRGATERHMAVVRRLLPTARGPG